MRNGRSAGSPSGEGSGGETIDPTQQPASEPTSSVEDAVQRTLVDARLRVVCSLATEFVAERASSAERAAAQRLVRAITAAPPWCRTALALPGVARRGGLQPQTLIRAVVGSYRVAGHTAFADHLIDGLERLGPLGDPSLTSLARELRGEAKADPKKSSALSRSRRRARPGRRHQSVPPIRAGLKEAGLYLVDLEGNRGYLQWVRQEGDQEPPRSPALGGGAWVFAMELIRPPSDANRAGSVTLVHLRTLLRDARIPVGKDGSLKANVAKVRRALGIVFGGTVPRDALRFQRRDGHVNFEGLARFLRTKGGASLALATSAPPPRTGPRGAAAAAAADGG